MRTVTSLLVTRFGFGCFVSEKLTTSKKAPEECSSYLAEARVSRAFAALISSHTCDLMLSRLLLPPPFTIFDNACRLKPPKKGCDCLGAK